MAHTTTILTNTTLSILTIGTLLTTACQSEEDGDVLGQVEQKVLEYNWIGPNWIGPNWIGPNWIGPNGNEPGNFTFNGLSLNPAIEVGLSVGGLGLEQVALDGLTVNGDLTVHGQPFSVEQEQAFAVLATYMVQCALPATQVVTMTTSDGTDVLLQGSIGLAPEWQTGGLTDAGQRRVSACVAARSNAKGKRVHISLRGANIQTHAVERSTFQHVEGSFWGDIFGNAPYVHTCSAKGGGVAGRDCTAGDCFFQDAGNCADVCTQWDATEGAFGDCDGEIAIITTYLPLTANDSFSGDHSCAIDGNGDVSCEGSNSHGQLGDGTTDDSNAPQLVALGDDVEASQLESGKNHTCARQKNGAVRCWGKNKNGQVGDGSDDRKVLSPAQNALVTDAMSLRSGANHVCVLEADGTVLCWGRNNNGQLGDGTIYESNVPVAVGLSSPALAITSENLSNHSCAITVAGTLECWGRNKKGQLGDGSHHNRRTPVAVLDAAGNALGDILTACTTRRSTCALQADGAVSCFGKLVDASTPVTIALAQPATTISCASNTACATLADGSTQCW